LFQRAVPDDLGTELLSDGYLHAAVPLP
jgi:hypothetical protein